MVTEISKVKTDPVICKVCGAPYSDEHFKKCYQEWTNKNKSRIVG